MTEVTARALQQLQWGGEQRLKISGVS